MKRTSAIYSLTSFVLFIAMTLCFTGCQKDELVLPGVMPVEPILYRTSPPSVPAILEVPPGYVVSFHTYAEGVQIYQCQEVSPGVFSWVFVAPDATLYANANNNGFLRNADLQRRS